MCFLGLQTVYLNKISTYTAPQIEDSYWHWISGSDLWLTGVSRLSLKVNSSFGADIHKAFCKHVNKVINNLKVS